MAHFNQFTENLKDKAEKTTAHAKDKAQDVYEAGKKQAHDAQKFLQDNAEGIVSVIKEKPIYSVLIAAGVGYLLAKLLK